MPDTLKVLISIFLGISWIFKLLLAQDPVAFGGTHFRSSSYFERIPNSLIDGQYITSSQVFTPFDCQMLCIQEARCLSFNFGVDANDKGLHLCEMFDITKNSDNGLVQTNLYDFYTVLSVPRSCSHAKSLGYHESTNYTIDPDARGELTEPFKVFCDMRDKNGVGVTVVSHDSQARTFVSGCEPRGCYRRDVSYDGISDVAAQLGALTKVSTHCEQYIRYECYGSMIRMNTDSPKAWLVSRDGRKLRYWGGAPPDSEMCACGVKKNCAEGQQFCNCDKNTPEMLEDSGLLTHKEDLPISELRFGDIDPQYREKGWHTLGELRCYGQA